MQILLTCLPGSLSLSDPIYAEVFLWIKFVFIHKVRFLLNIYSSEVQSVKTNRLRMFVERNSDSGNEQSFLTQICPFAVIP